MRTLRSSSGSRYGLDFTPSSGDLGRASRAGCRPKGLANVCESETQVTHSTHEEVSSSAGWASTHCRVTTTWYPSETEKKEFKWCAWITCAGTSPPRTIIKKETACSSGLSMCLGWLLEERPHRRRRLPGYFQAVF